MSKFDRFKYKNNTHLYRNILLDSFLTVAGAEKQMYANDKNIFHPVLPSLNTICRSLENFDLMQRLSEKENSAAGYILNQFVSLNDLYLVQSNLLLIIVYSSVLRSAKLPKQRVLFHR